MSRYNSAGQPEIDESGPRIEDTYSALDAVVVGDLLIALLNNSDRVRVACLAQLVNVIAPIRTVPGGAAWRQTTFHPIAAVAAAARGRSLVARVDGPELATRRHGDVPAIAAAATLDPETGRMSTFITNRAAEPINVSLSLRGQAMVVENCRALLADDDASQGERAAPDAAFDLLATQVGQQPNTVRFTVPGESWVTLTTHPTQRS